VLTTFVSNMRLGVRCFGDEMGVQRGRNGSDEEVVPENGCPAH